MGAKVKLVSTPAKNLFDGAIRLRYGLPCITSQLGLYFSGLFQGKTDGTRIYGGSATAIFDKKYTAAVHGQAKAGDKP